MRHEDELSLRDGIGCVSTVLADASIHCVRMRVAHATG